MQKLLSPEVVHNVCEKAKCEGKLKYEYVGKIMDGGFYIAEKMIVFWLDTGICIFRAKPQKFGDFVALTYVQEKYPNECGSYNKIIAEISGLRREYTSGIWIGDKRIC